MKALMISGDGIVNPSRGNQKLIYNYCQMLKNRGWKLDFIYLGKADKSDFITMRNFLGEGDFYCTGSIIQSFLGEYNTCFRGLINSKSSELLKWNYFSDELYDERIGELVSYLYDKNKYDIVWLQYLYHSKCLSLLPKDCLKVIYTHDRFANRYKIFKKIGVKNLSFSCSENAERKLLSRADVVLAIQKCEEIFFKQLLSGTQTRVETAGFIGKYNNISHIEEPVFGFIGADYSPNIHGLKWFINNVIPILKTKLPNYKFLIAGKVCETIPDSDDYIKLGIVADVTDFYRQIKVAISPIFSGTGLKIKCIEALFYGIPLVGTDIAFEGMEDASNCFYAANDAESFASNIVGILTDNCEYRELLRSIEKYVDNYTRDQIATIESIEQLIFDRNKKND